MKSENFFIQFLHSIWNCIKRIFRGIVNFVKDIVSFFKDPSRLKKLKEKSNLIAVSIKEKLKSGDYNVVNCLFDNETETVLDMDTDAVGIDAEELDSETEQTFGTKSMVILG